MQLRSSINQPARFEDDETMERRPRNRAVPSYSELIRAQAIPFNPNHPPAAFPSLPLTAQQPSQPVNDPTAGPSEVSPSPASLIASLLEEALARAINEDAVPSASDEQFLEAPTAAEMDSDETQSLTSATNHLPSALRNEDNTEDDDTPTWNSLPLSLQHHIFTTLLGQYSPEALVNVLGLTEQETREMETAISERLDHPESLDDIWDYCVRNSTPVPGLPDSQTYIEPDMLSRFMDPMLFASRYEYASDAEVQLARDFLLLRGIPAETVGTWQPDPADEFLTSPDDQARLDSGHPSADFGQNANEEADDQPGPDAALTTAGSDEASPLVVQNKHLRPSIQEKSPGRRKRPAPKSQKGPSRHPLANVMVPGASDGSPESDDEDAQAENTRPSQEPEITGTRLVLKFRGQTILDTAPEEKQEASRQAIPTTSTHVDKVGEATTSLPDRSTTQAPLSPNVNFGTKLSAFSKRLILDNTDTAEASLSFENEDDDPASSAVASSSTRRPAPVPSVPSKRRASPPDLRRSPPQVRRTAASRRLMALGPENSPGAEASQQRETGNMGSPIDTNGVMLSIETPGPGAASNHCDAESHPNQAGVVRRPTVSPITDMGSPPPPPRMVTRPTISPITDMGSPPDFTPGVRSPSFSPISENADLPEYQALLRGPGARKLRKSAAERETETETPEDAEMYDASADESESGEDETLVQVKDEDEGEGEDEEEDDEEGEEEEEEKEKGEAVKKSATPKKKATPSTPKSGGPKRPYRKTRERVAREEQARAEARARLRPRSRTTI